jgi:catechol 2,3-dioxygenase-like lactoylglutathione lyase family enzyme
MPHIAAFTIVVDDMHRSLDFYRRLGLDAPATADTRGFVTSTLGSGTQLAFKRRPTQPRAPGRLTIGVRCADAHEVDAIYRSLVDAGHAGVIEPGDAPWGAWRCRLLAPDGNVVELFAPLP